MTILIPSFGSVQWASPGERRFAERLLLYLEDDYMCWYDVPVGSSKRHPDFIILHPRRGILVLEIKDWKLDTIRTMDKISATVLTSSGPKQVANPLQQARQYAHELCRLFEGDKALVRTPDRRHGGKLVFPWGYGVVFTNITRKQFDTTDLGEILSPDLVICKDEMAESLDAEHFQRRLWNMFRPSFPCTLSLPQVDRIRWHLFPQIRIGSRKPVDKPGTAGSGIEEIPDLVGVMDLQQEQLARSLGAGHRIIHGVAGSGKTMILGYRCEHLAHTLTKPVLVLCFNKPLAAKLDSMIHERGIQSKVTVRNFHRWCREQLILYRFGLPGTGVTDYAGELVNRIVAAVDTGQVPRAQYGAVLIDEGHDFDPAWLKLVVQMVDPETNSFLLLYDDAQSLYGKQKRRAFTFAKVGIQALGRSTILRLNYRNTTEVLAVAYEFAREAMTPQEAEEDDGIPILSPQSSGRHGRIPQLVQLSTLQGEALYIVRQLREFHASGVTWKDMAVLYRAKFIGERIVAELERARIPAELQGQATTSRRYDPVSNSVKVLTMHSSKGLEFPVTIVAGVGYMPLEQQELADEARLLYVAMTRAMDELIITCHKESIFTRKIADALQRAA